MNVTNNIFNKIMILILLLLLPILGLYTYSNQVSVKVIKDELESSSMSRLQFLLNQVETNLEQFGLFSTILSRETSILDYKTIHLMENVYKRIELQKEVAQKLELQSASVNWDNQISVYSIPAQEVTSTYFRIYDAAYLKRNVSDRWTLRTTEVEGQQIQQFVKFTLNPVSAYMDFSKADLVVEVSFYVNNLVRMLNDFKKGAKGDPFFYHPDYTPIVNHTSDADKIYDIQKKLHILSLTDAGRTTLNLGGEEYQVYYVKSPDLGWYLVDYVPVQEILSPVIENRNYFYMTTGLLLTMSLTAAFLLYRNVRVPIRELTKGVQSLKRGDYSVRLTHKFHNEFDYLFLRFNEMTMQIQELIENVFAERLRSREATLKQLQAQINPHFLYNCLFFIKSMASMGNDKAVISMSLKLGEYFRYTTRVEKDYASIADELKLVTNYLEIQMLRSPRFEFETDLPEDMLNMEIPRLLLQPIVENAVIHGLEGNPNAGMIKITGEIQAECYRLIVEDNGLGVTPDRLQELRDGLNDALEDEMGCGVWNVHHRLIYRFGEGSGLVLEPVDPQGLRVILQWNRGPEHV
ncbi:hypothetical protein SY83_03040 [Paenibacillus swuensis]|uniref:HAMP domain-containing protein n=1 Tax=Paenibacillus swuensis TaxID=1178515 RepID=A0A172TEH5_9BACL|nr:sensor histidine kinase [Paenibacillus swuensis]ANE45465.1 hypothetical protein SY83_03040 [Paenibacillus swuensis]